MNGLKSRIVLFLSSCIYTFSLNWAYINLISPQYSYLGYTYHQSSIFLLLVSFFMAVMPSLWIPISLIRPSLVVYWLLYVLVFIPAMIIPQYTLTVELVQLLFLEICLFAAFWLLASIYKLPLLNIPRIKISKSLFWIVIVFLSFIFFSYIISVFGFRINLVSITDVYGLRAGYKEIILDKGRMLGYTVNWLANVINPFLIVRGLIGRNPVLLIIGIIGQLIIFSITGFKSVLFSGLLIIALIIAMRFRGKLFGLYVIWGSVGIIFISSLMEVWFKFGLFSSLFIRRLIVTPGLLTGYYFDFFSENPKVLLSHSILKILTDYPYDLSPPHIIGYYYFGNAGTSANANIWADAFANFGFGGIFVFTVLLGLVLYLYDSLTKNRNYLIASCLLGIPAFSLTNSALLTCMLTHGIGFAFLIVYFLPRDSEVQSYKSVSINSPK